MKKTLRSSEWCLVSGLLVVMFALVIIAKVSAYRSCSTLPAAALQPKKCIVTIEGAVAKPGEYTVLSGTTLAEVLRKARPKPYANIKILPLEQVVEGPFSLQVEELSEIKIFVRGAVIEPVELLLPAKSRISDLRTKVSLAPGADKSFFRRKRVLKDGDVIEVPKKTVE